MKSTSFGALLLAVAAASDLQRPLRHGHSDTETPLLQLHRQLVQIDSTIGSEQSVGDWLVDYLEEHKFVVDKQFLTNDTSRRFNIHAYPETRQTRTLLTSHLDTVPPYYNYSTKRSHGELEIWGRGSVDDKACVAAQIIALQNLLASRRIDKGDVGLLFVVGEEGPGDGMAEANHLGLKWDAVVFGEPTESMLAAGHKGLLQARITVKGKAAHSGYPWLGRSANEVLISALAAIELLKHVTEEDGGLPRSKKFGETTINVGLISGGVAANVVAEAAQADVAFRLAGGSATRSKEIVLRTINDATEEFLKDGKASLSVEWIGEAYGPVDIDADISGFNTTTVNYGTDVPHLYGKHKRYLYGPGSILVAHGDHEHLTARALERAVLDYEKIVLEVLDKLD